MSRETVCRPYIRTYQAQQGSSVPKSAAAEPCRALSCLRRWGLETGKAWSDAPGSFSPTRPRRTARATAPRPRPAPQAGRWSPAPTAGAGRIPAWVSVVTGMPVQSETTAATSSAVTVRGVTQVPARRKAESPAEVLPASRSMAAFQSPGPEWPPPFPWPPGWPSPPGCGGQGECPTGTCALARRLRR